LGIEPENMIKLKESKIIINAIPNLKWQDIAGCCFFLESLQSSNAESFLAVVTYKKPLRETQA